MCPRKNHILGTYSKKSAAPGTNLHRVRCVQRGLPGKPPDQRQTAVYLQRHTTDLQNRKDLRIVLSVMEQVPVSKNVEQDFQRCGQSRSMADYQRLLELCRVFCRERVLLPFLAEKPHWRSSFPWSAYLKAMWRQSYDSIWIPCNIEFMFRQKANISLNYHKNSLPYGQTW